MKKYILAIASVLMLFSSCTHKDLCLYHRDHAHKYHINIVADYRFDWEEHLGGINWQQNWPASYVKYDSLRPSKPKGIRVINYNQDNDNNVHNIGPDGGSVVLYEGPNDILLYNNDTEYIVFSRSDNSASTRATTRTRTRATYNGSEYANTNEETMTPPDVLFANFITGYIPKKVSSPTDLEITMHPLVFTYKIRYEFDSGIEYVALARGALSGMARSVLINTGETSQEAATLLFDCSKADYGIKAYVNSFGIPAYPNENYPSRLTPKHALNLEILLKNGSMITFDYDVTDQVQAQPRGGVIVVKGIVIKPEEGTQGAGSFDVEVNDWGPYQDIDLPL